MILIKNIIIHFIILNFIGCTKFDFIILQGHLTNTESLFVCRGKTSACGIGAKCGKGREMDFFDLNVDSVLKNPGNHNVPKILVRRRLKKNSFKRYRLKELDNVKVVFRSSSSGRIYFSPDRIRKLRQVS